MVQASDSPINPVRWGVLGAARIAEAKTIPGMVASSWCVPQAIGARDLARAKSLADKFGVPSAYGSYEEVLNDPRVEAVYIALPNHLHVEWTIAAARKGKHVLCEKPIALTADEARLLTPLSGRVEIAEAFMVRQQPRWRALQDILRSGRYGEPRSVQMLLSFFMNNPEDFRNKPEFGGGALYDLGCYTSMTARYIFESEPRRVVAVAQKDANGIDTTTTAILDFKNGRHAAFTVSVAMASSQTLHVVCERGFVDLPKPYVPARHDPSLLTVDTSASHDLSDVTVTSFEPIDQYENEVTGFSKTIRNGAATYFGVEDAIANMRVMDAIFASANSGLWEEVRRSEGTE